MIGITLIKVGITAFLVFFLFMLLDVMNGTKGSANSPTWISIPGGLAVVVAVVCLVSGGVCAIWGL